MWYTHRQGILTVRTDSLGVIPKHGDGVILSKTVVVPAAGGDVIDDTYPRFKTESPRVALASVEHTRLVSSYNKSCLPLPLSTGIKDGKGKNTGRDG